MSTELNLEACPHCAGQVTWCECGKCGRVWCAACAVMTEFSPPDECDTLDKERAFCAEIWNRRAATKAAAPADAPTDLPRRLRIKAGVMASGEKIAWGSDTELMLEAADYIERAAPVEAGAAPAHPGEGKEC